MELKVPFCVSMSQRVVVLWWCSLQDVSVRAAGQLQAAALAALSHFAPLPLIQFPSLQLARATFLPA